MNGRKTIVGLCMLCALLTSAFAAQSASAVEGTTAVTCKEGPGDTGKPTFNTNHCLPGEGTGAFGHYAINETTELTGRAGSATTKIKFLLGGVQTTLTSTGLTVSSAMENKVNGKEHYAHGTGTGVFAGVGVGPPWTKCFVYTDEGPGVGAKEVIDTELITGTTAGQGMGVKFEPVNEAKVFARFWILDKNKTIPPGGECAIAGTYAVTGSVIGTPEGATINFTHVETTTQGTLKLAIGATTIKAGVEGSLTFEGSKVGAKAFNPLSVTTYPETP